MTAECIGIPFPDTCECGHRMKEVPAGVYRVARAGTKWEHENLPEKLWLHIPDLELGCREGSGRARVPPPYTLFDPYDADAYLYGIYGY